MRRPGALALGLVLARAALACAAEPEDTQASPGQTRWTAQLPSAAQDRGLDLQADDDGVVVAGYRAIASDDPEADARADAWLARFDPDGALEWEATFHHEAGDAFVSGVALDGAGRIAVAGGVWSEADDWDLWLAVYEPDGALRWSEVVAGEAHREDQAVGVAADPQREELFAVGYVMAEDGTTDAWLRRYGIDGDVRSEELHAGAFGGIDVATDVAFDPRTGDVLVVGYETVGEDDTDIWVRAIDRAGATRWTMLADEAGGADRGQGIAPDPAGGAFVVGHAVVPGRTVDAWIGRVDDHGELAWRVLHDGPASLGDGANDVATAPDGTLVVGGYEFEDAGKWNAWLRKLDPDQVTIWTHVYAGPAAGDDVIAGVAIDPGGEVYAVGSASVAADGREIWLRKVAG